MTSHGLMRMRTTYQAQWILLIDQGRKQEKGTKNCLDRFSMFEKSKISKKELHRCLPIPKDYIEGKKRSGYKKNDDNWMI
jgi:hypothetical protein